MIQNIQTIHVAVCDDDETILHLLNSKIFMVFGNNYSVVIRLYSQSQLLITDADNQRFDLVFLDIEMPGMDGFRLAERLLLKIPDAFIVFISNHENFVYSSFQFQPLWFLRKSRIKDELPAVIAKYLEQSEFSRASFCFPYDGEKKSLFIKDITYLECIGREIKVNTLSHEKFIYSGSLKKTEIQLEKYNFIRAHKSYLINQTYIFSLDGEAIVLMDRTELPVSKSRKKKIKELLVKDW